jgi:hypothetical protein
MRSHPALHFWSRAFTPHIPARVAAPSRLSATLGLALVLSACGSSWKVVRQATPNPFGQTTAVALDKVTFDGLTVGGKPEGEWLSERSDAQSSAWSEAKAAMVPAFADALVGAAGEHLSPRGPFALRVHFYHYDPGAYTVVGPGDPLSWPSYLVAEVYIVDSSGTPVDEVRISGQGAGQVVERAEACARDVGEKVGEYLRERFGNTRKEYAGD